MHSADATTTTNISSTTTTASGLGVSLPKNGNFLQNETHNTNSVAISTAIPTVSTNTNSTAVSCTTVDEFLVPNLPAVQCCSPLPANRMGTTTIRLDSSSKQSNLISPLHTTSIYSTNQTPPIIFSHQSPSQFFNVTTEKRIPSLSNSFLVDNVSANSVQIDGKLDSNFPPTAINRLVARNDDANRETLESKPKKITSDVQVSSTSAIANVNASNSFTLLTVKSESLDTSKKFEKIKNVNITHPHSQASVLKLDEISTNRHTGRLPSINSLNNHRQNSLHSHTPPPPLPQPSFSSLSQPPSYKLTDGMRHRQSLQRMDCVSIRSSSCSEIANLPSNACSSDDDEEEAKCAKESNSKVNATSSKANLKSKSSNSKRNLAASSPDDICKTTIARQPSAELSKFRRFVNKIQILRNWNRNNELDLERSNDLFGEHYKSNAKAIELDVRTYLCFGNLVIDPGKSAHYYWLICISICVLYNLITIIGRSVFWQLQNSFKWLWVFGDYTCDFMYIIDMIVNARTAYLEQGLLVRNSNRLLRNYSRRFSFKLDLLSILPTDLYLIRTGLYCDSQAIPCSVIVRLNRLLRIHRMSACFDRIETRTNFPNAFRIAKLIFIILVVIHWNGCFYFYMSYLIGFSSDRWVYNNTAGPELSAQYIYCFYWSTLTLTAIGEVPTPTSDPEYLFVIIDFLIGVLIFATIVGNVGSMITNMNQSRADFQAKMDAVKQYMEFRRISKSLENRVIKWFDYLWSNKQSLDEESVLNILPDKLKAEIAIHVHLDTLKKVKLFQDCESGLLEQLVLKLRLQVFSPGKEMYIVKKGKLSVVSEDGLIVYANLTDGAVFGELSVLNIQGNKTGNRRSASVCSVGYSDLFCLSKSDLWQVLEEYPEAKAMLIERGKQILAKDNLLDEEGLREAQQAEVALRTRCERLQLSVDRLSGSLARLLAEYAVAQRHVKRRLAALERQLMHSHTPVSGSARAPHFYGAISLDLPNVPGSVRTTNGSLILDPVTREAQLRRTYSEQ